MAEINDDCNQHDERCHCPECKINWLTTGGTTRTLKQTLINLIDQHGIAEILERLTDLVDFPSDEEPEELLAGLRRATEAALQLANTLNNTPKSGTLTIPREFPAPKFKFGERIKEIWDDPEGGEHVQWGKVVGMTWNREKRVWGYHCYWDKFSHDGNRPFYDDVPTPEDELQAVP